MQTATAIQSIPALPASAPIIPAATSTVIPFVSLTEENTDVIIDALDAEQTGPNKWKARCVHPEHPDQHPSMDVEIKPSGKFVLICRSRHCPQDELVAGLRKRIAERTAEHLEEGPSKANGAANGIAKAAQWKRPFKVDEVKLIEAASLSINLVEAERALENGEPLPEWRRLPVEFCFRRGISAKVARAVTLGFTENPRPSLVIPLAFESGFGRNLYQAPWVKTQDVYGIQLRFIEPPDERKKWLESSGSRNDLIYLADAPAVSSSGVVFVLEGPIDALTVRSLGFSGVAIMSTGIPTVDQVELSTGASLWKACIARLRSYDRVVIIGDSDEPGRRAVRNLQQHIPEAIIAPALPVKDIGDLFQTQGREATIKWLSDLEKWALEQTPGSIAEEAKTEPAEPHPYPDHVWDGTLYGDFARICAEGNHIPKRFFIEALKTVAGAVIGGQIRIHRMADLEARFYVILIGPASQGKTTAVKWAERVFPENLLFVDEGPHGNIGACHGGVGSGNGIQRLFGISTRALMDDDEIAKLFDKMGIPSSGESLLANVLALYEGTHTIGNLTKTDKTGPVEAHLSILGCITPDKWETIFTKTGAVGSGMLSRLNLIDSIDTETVSPLEDPDPADMTKFKAEFIPRLIQLEANPVVCYFSSGARQELTKFTEWLNARPEEADCKARLNTLVLRNAMHMSWLLNRPMDIKDIPPHPVTGHQLFDAPVMNVAIDRDIIQRSVELAEYELAVRKTRRPIDADNAWAIMEQKIEALVESRGKITRSECYRATNARRAGLQVFKLAIQNLWEAKAINVISEETGRKKYEMLVYVGDHKRRPDQCVID